MKFRHTLPSLLLSCTLLLAAVSATADNHHPFTGNGSDHQTTSGNTPPNMIEDARSAGKQIAEKGRDLSHSVLNWSRDIGRQISTKSRALYSAVTEAQEGDSPDES